MHTWRRNGWQRRALGAVVLGVVVGLIGGASAEATGLSFFAEDEHVQVVDKRKVQQEVLSSGQPYVVGIFSAEESECPSCPQFAAEFSKVAKYLSGYGVQAVAVDCSKSLPKCGGALNALQVTQIPDIKAFVTEPSFNPYTHKMTREPVHVAAAGTLRAFQKNVLSKMPSELLPRQEAGAFPPETDGKALVLLFTDRESTSPLYKALALHFKGRLAFAEVHSSQEDLVQQFGVQSFPTMLVVTVGSEGELDDGSNVYDGDLKKWSAMTTFLSGYALAETPDASASGSSSSQEPPRSRGQRSGASSAGLVLDEDSFPATVLKAKDAWVVLYKSSAEEESHSEWSKLASKSDGFIERAEVHCDSTPSLCDGDVPHVKVFPYGEEEKEDVMAIDRFPPKASVAAYTAAAQSLPDLSKVVNPVTLETTLMQSLENQRVTLLLLSNKDEPPTMLKSLALALDGAADVGFFPSPDAEVLQRFQVPRVPMFVVMFVHDGSGEGAQTQPLPDDLPPNALQFGVRHFDPAMYGRPSFDSVFSFTLATAQALFPESAQATLDQASAAASAAQRGEAAKGEIPEVTPENWETLCPASSSTLCAIGFFSGGKDSESFEEEMAVLRSAMAAHTSDPYKFMWADGGCRLQFADSFDVQPTKLPTVVALSPKKQRFASFIGVYRVDAVNDLLNGVLSGRVKTKPLYQSSTPDQVDCAALAAEVAAQAASEDAMVEDEDLGDLMAEILAEEERKKKELEEEAARELEALKKAKEEEEAKAKLEAAAAAKKKGKKGKKGKKKAKKAKKGGGSGDL